MATEDFLRDDDEIEAALIAVLGRSVALRIDMPDFDRDLEIARAVGVVREEGRDDRHARTLRLASLRWREPSSEAIRA